MGPYPAVNSGRPLKSSRSEAETPSGLGTEGSEVPTGRGGGVVHSRTDRGWDPRSLSRFRGESTVTTGAAEPPSGPQGPGGSTAIGALGRRVGRPSRSQGDHTKSFHLQDGSHITATPELDAIPGSEHPNDRRERLRRFERDRVEGGAVEVGHPQPNMSAAQRERRVRDEPGYPPRAELDEVVSAPAHQMVAGTLIRPEQKPSIDALRDHPASGPQRSAGVRASQPEENRTRGVRSDQKSSSARVMTEEESWNGPPRGSHGLRLHVSLRSFANQRAVGDQFPGDPPAGPGNRGARSHDPSAIARGADECPRGLELPPYVIDGNHLSDGPVIHSCRRRVTHRHERGVRFRFPCAGTPQHAFPGPVDEPAGVRRGERRVVREAPHREAPHLAEARPPSPSPAEARRKRGVPAGLPRDIGVEAN